MNKIMQPFKKNRIDFDMYNNLNNDDCKSKYNSLIYFVAEFITNLKQGSYSRKEKKYYLDILNYNKEAVLMYLNFAVDILSNQVINEDTLLNENMNMLKI